MPLQGTLDTFALPDVLRLLVATKKSGRLRITAPRGAGSVWVTEGAVVALEATHAPQASEAVDALVELLRFRDGSFAFEAEVTHDEPGPATDVEVLLEQAEVLLAEWREIEAVVPSLDAYVTLRRTLEAPAVSIPQEHWTALVTVGGGSTVRRIADELGLAEIPVSRAVRDLVDLGVIEIAVGAPAGPADVPVAGAAAPSTSPLLTADRAPVAGPAAPVGGDDAEPPAESGVESVAEPGAESVAESVAEPGVESVAESVAESGVESGVESVAESGAESGAESVAESGVEAPPIPGEAADVAPEIPEVPEDEGALPPARPLRARRSKAPAPVDDGPQEPERFVPLELPGYAAPPRSAEDSADGEPAPAVDDLAGAAPGLADESAAPSPEDEELARQLATLSPRAADAVRAAAEGATDEERDAAPDEADASEDSEDAPINRGLLLKFLSSVRS